MTTLFGHWQLDRHENMEAYLKAIGMNIILRKVALSLTSCEEIKRDGELWEVHLTSTFKNGQLKFKLGEEFEEETLDGRKVKSTFTLEGEKLIHRQFALKEGGENSTITREVDGEKLIIRFPIQLSTTPLNGVVLSCIRNLRRFYRESQKLFHSENIGIKTFQGLNSGVTAKRFYKRYTKV